MKNFVLAVALVCAAVVAVQASCSGPFCWDESNGYVAGAVCNGNGLGFPLLTSAQINAASPVAKGMQVFCTDCGTWNTFKGGICTSTGTAPGAFIQVSSATSIANCK